MELSPRKIGLLGNVKIYQRNKQNGAAITELNQMQFEIRTVPSMFTRTNMRMNAKKVSLNSF